MRVLPAVRWWDLLRPGGVGLPGRFVVFVMVYQVLVRLWTRPSRCLTGDFGCQRRGRCSEAKLVVHATGRDPVVLSEEITRAGLSSCDWGWFPCMGVLEPEKGIRWMPWHQEAMKDVARCEKPRGAASRR
jgi:hypothetical protein